MFSVDLGDITIHNLKQLKKINQVVFPVSYNDKFYKDVLELGPLAKLGKKKYLILKIYYKKSYLYFLAYFNDIVVGGVCCRIDLTENKRRLYIMTLGCLSAYRRYGVGMY